MGRCCHCQQGTAHTEALLPQQHYYPVIANGGTGLAKRNDLGWSEAIPRYNKKDMHFQKDFTLSRGGNPIQTEQTPYEIFISYRRKDNQPIHPGEPGWVSALRDHIPSDHRRFSTEPLAIFFHAAEINDMDDWERRILGALQRSKILLICLSPNYFNSPYCHWEWEEYLTRQVPQLMGSDSVASIYFVQAPGSAAEQNKKWYESV